MIVLTPLFAGLAGVEPNACHSLELERALFFRPLARVSFRLSSPNKFSDRTARARRVAAAFGGIGGPDYGSDERALRSPNLGHTPKPPA